MTAAAALERLGRQGVIGVSLLVFAGAFYAGGIAPSQQRLEQLEARAARLEKERGARAAHEAPAESELASFYALLATPERMRELTARVFELGKQYEVTLRQGSYRVTGDAHAPFARYEISYQTQAAYYRVRLFLRELMREMPMVALEDIHFQRQSASVPAPEISLKISFLVRQP